MKKHILLVVTLLLLCSCSRKKRKTETAAPQTPPAAANPDTSNSPGFLLHDRVRLTPEQISKHIEATFGMKMGYKDNFGNFRDSIIEGYGVALGGIDYFTASQRDPSTKVQTLLVLRSLSWWVTNGAINDTYEPGVINFMTIADVRNDRPFHPSDANRSAEEQAAINAGEARWRAQIDDFYLRLFSRHPSEEEISILRAGFLEAWEAQNKFTPQAWRLIFFSLVSTMEFWSL